jgi:hypothetical protein
MSQRYLELRYLQLRVMLVIAVLCLIAQGIIWFSGIMKGVEDPWLEWPFGVATLLFVFTVYDFLVPSFEVKVAIDKGQHLSPAEQQTLDKVFYSGVIGFTLGLIAFLFSIYKLVAHAT